MIDRLKKRLTFILKCSMAVAMTFACISSYIPQKVHAKETIEYEIYPIPHEMNYLEGEFIIRPQVNIVFDSTIDEATRNHIQEVVGLKTTDITISSEKVEGKTNIFIGTYQSGEYADQYIQENYSVDASLFEHYGAHFLTVNNGEICILGTDTDGAFYGITSLKHIFNQMDGATIRHLEIKDYADTEFRGFIEGYYGNPWSNEDRKSLMRFGGDFKMTSYIYAPKNEPYHTNKWRELYPEEELEEIRKMVEVGNASKCRFVWTAHPFMGGFDTSNVEGEIEALLNKFEQLYSVGVRQFGVLGDDVGTLDRQVVIQVMDAVAQWAKEKGDVYDTVFCPAGYNHGRQDGSDGSGYAELNDYDAAFSDDIQIFWTGEVVRGALEQKTLDHFRTYKATEGQERRAPLFWLNWPVNDGTDEQRQSMKLGRADLLKTNVNVEDLAGVVTNPMQEAEASKVSLFAIADYAWNVHAFDVNQSWEDSFKYVEPDASEALFVLAKHMSLDSYESTELASLIQEVQNKITNGEELGESADQLIREMEIIIQACDEFNSVSKNENLKKELEPFTGSLRDLAQAIQEFTAANVAADSGNTEEAVKAYLNAEGLLLDSQNHIRESRGSIFKVTPAKRRLIPLGNFLESEVKEKVQGYIIDDEEESEDVFTITASGNLNSLYEGKIENILDGDPSTYVWYKGEAKGQYFQLNFSEPTTVYGIHILNGKDGKLTNTFEYGKLKYTTDGVSWIDVDGIEYGPRQEKIDVSTQLENVVAIRYECTRVESKAEWVAMRDFTVDLKSGEENPDFTMEVIHTSEEEGWEGTQSANPVNMMIDGDPDTYTHFRVRPNDGNNSLKGDYVGIKLSEPISLRRIYIVQGKNDSHADFFHDETLQYSMNGIDWYDIETFNETRTIDIDVSSKNIKAQYIRLINNADCHNWVAIREFQVEPKTNNYNGKVYTNVDVYSSYGANYSDDENYIGAVDHVLLEKGQYIGLKLDRIHELKEIVSSLSQEGLTIEVSKNEIEWEEVKAGEVSADARYIRIINHTDEAIDFNIQQFTVKTNEIHEKSLIDYKGYNASVDPQGAFDGDWETTLYFNGTPYEGNYMTFDLGQVVHLDSLKVVIKDSRTDYPRHGRFLVSMDGEKWTEVLTLGNQHEANPGEEAGEDLAFIFPDNDANFRYKEVKDLNIDVRYLKFEVTMMEVYEKYVKLSMNEIIINDGEYLSTINDPTYDSNIKETKDGQFIYMSDNDLTTMYIPNETNGYVTYSMSENTDDNIIKIVQNNSLISNANVSARIYTDANGAEWITLGTLSQVVNEFVLPENTKLLDIKIDWEDVIPNIIEMFTYKAEVEPVDKTELAEYLQNMEDTSTWTSSSQSDYLSSIESGKRVNESVYASQTMVDDAVSAIEMAINNKLLKGDPTKLEEMMDQVETDASLYTARSWKGYAEVVEMVQKALDNKDDLTQEQIDGHLASLSAAKDALVYNPTTAEKAELLAEDIKSIIEGIEDSSIYTKNSYDELIASYDALMDLLKQDEEKALHPTAFKEPMERAEKAKDHLVLVLSLPELIKEFEAVDGSLYTKESYERYKTAVEAGKELLASGTDETIANAINAINTAKGQLELIYSAENLKELLADAQSRNKDDYTEASYSDLSSAIEKASDVVDRIDEATPQEIKEVSELLQEKINGLVNIKSLKEIIKNAEALDSTNYTKDSYDALVSELQKANEVMKNGNSQEADQCIQAIHDAMTGLVIKADEEEANAYISSISEINYELYTQESAEAYKTALNTLKEMQKDYSNVSAEAFIEAKEAFEKASADLELLPADYTQVEEAVARIPDDLSEYTDETVKALEDAVGAVVYDLDITHQKEVDEVADAINQAIDRLSKKTSGSVNTSDTVHITFYLTIAGLALLFLGYSFQKRCRKCR